MREAMRKNSHDIATPQEKPRRSRRRIIHHCSICTVSIPLEAISVSEPQDAPEPRSSWVLCKTCYRALLTEIRRSPIRSPLRLRIAIGLVASERWPRPHSPTRQFAHDHQAIIFIAWVFVAAMLVHLALIVMIAFVAK